MKGLTNAVIIQGSSGGGDVVYAANDSAKEYSANDKVFLNFRGVEQEATQTSEYSSQLYPYFIGTQAYLGGYDLYKEVYDENAKSWTDVDLGYLLNNISGLQTFRDGTVVANIFNAFIRDDVDKMAIANGQVNYVLRGIYLGNNLVLYSTSTENTFELREYNPADNTFGDTYSTFSGLGYTYNALYDNGYLILIQNNSYPTFRFYDITNKSSPSLLNTQSLNGYLIIKGATGTNVGDFLFGTTDFNDSGYYSTGTLKIYQIDSTPSLANPTDLPSDLQSLIGVKANAFYDVRTKILTVGTHDKVYAWSFDETTKTFHSLNIDIDLSGITNMHTDGAYLLALSSDYKTAFVGYRRQSSSYVYPVIVRYKYTDATGWAIVDFNNVNEGSITGIATGNKDDEENYEITTVLPQKLSYSVTVTPDPDTFTFTGEVQ